MTETPADGPSRGRPPTPRKRPGRATTPVPEPSAEELAALDELLPTLPAPLRDLAGHLTRRRLVRIERALGHRTWTLTVILHGIDDPHNQAAVLRTAEGLGLSEVHWIPAFEGSWDPSGAVTQNAHKWLRVHRHPDFATAAELCRSRGMAVRATAFSPDAAAPWELDWTSPVAIVLGNEIHGLPEEIVGACDGSVELPMYGFGASYNISVAAAMVLWHAVEERRRRWGDPGDLEGDDLMLLRTRYYRRAAGRRADPIVATLDALEDRLAGD